MSGGPRVSPRGLLALQAAALALVVLGSGLLWWAETRLDPQVAYLRQDADAPWITTPQPPRLKTFQVRREDPTRFTFATRWRLARPPARASLEVHALRDLQLSLNGRPVPLGDRDPDAWRRGTRVEVGDLLVAGTNRLEAVVANPQGPPLLKLRIADGTRTLVASGRGWRVSRDDRGLPAAIAVDVREPQQAADLPTPAAALRARALPLAVAFVLGALPVLLGGRRPRWLAALGGERAALAALGVFWLALLAKAVTFPPNLGFDVEGHYAYLRFLAENHRLPLATDGWSMFHPPLYHLVTALLRGVAGPEGGLGDRIALHLLPVAAGFTTALMAARIARRVLPDLPGAPAVAALAGGLLPMNVYISTFVSNESLQAGLVAVSLWLACEALVDAHAGARRLAALAAALSLALLAKTTTVPVVLAVVGVLLAKLWLVEGRSAGRALLATGGLTAGVLAAAGWFYLRNWRLFGNPFVTNYDLPDWTYWLPPGFHTPEWYRGFGSVLRHPYFASFTSFWDGLYSTFWGDGQGSGRLGVEYPSPWWNYDAMAAVYPLALPATVLLVCGLVVCAARAARGADLGRRLALCLLLCVAYGMLLLVLLTTLRYPHYALPKAFYGLAAAAPLAVGFAAGAVAADRRLAELGRGARAVLHGWGAALALAIGLAFLG